ncbi:MAG: protein kinase, partial [Myxococcota bacterium]|nr:protein kinase [Myxococcota bacterium]
MKRIGEYEIKKQLREEDLGQLYLAAKDDEDFDLLIVSEAVLKSRSARKRFLERMRKLTDQPRFSSWRRVFEEDGRVVLLHAPQAHPSLEDEIQQKSALDWRKALELGSKIANILANAHGLEPSLSHGDLRPEHVELLPAGEVRLRHFGAAQIADEVTEDRARSLRRLRYLSPEQLDYDEATPRSDIYSLALIIFEMISGEPVFTQATEQDIESAKLKAVDLSLPATLQHKVPERLEPLLESMLAVDPAARPARIADIGKEFDAMLAKSPGGSAMENDVVQRYLSRLDAEKARRNAMLTQDDRRGIALDLGMSREELLAAEEAAEAYWTRGEGYLEHQLWDDAIEQLTNAFELSPERVEILFSLARAHHGRWQAKGAKKDAIEAQRIARRCIDIDPRHPEAFKLLAELDKAMAEAKASEPDHEPKPVPVSRRSAMSKQKPGLMQLSLIGLLTALLGLVFWFAVDPLGAWHLAPPTNPPAQPQTQDPPHTPPVVPPHTPPTPPVTPDTPVVPPHAQSAARLDTADQTAMLLVAEGKATFGSPSGEGEADEQPERIRELPDFYMDETEITVASYQRCVNDGFCANAFFTSWSS